MTLSTDERVWLDAYREALAQRQPGLVEEMIVYGSKARDEAGPDSDLDLLVILREADRARKREVRRIGHRLAAASDVVPSIMVYSREEWRLRQRGGGRCGAPSTVTGSG